MEPIGNLFGHLKQYAPDRRSEYGDMLVYFRDQINRSRAGTKFKPLTTGYFARKLQGLNLADLYYLKSVCEEAHRSGFGFSKKFFYELRERS